MKTLILEVQPNGLHFDFPKADCDRLYLKTGDRVKISVEPVLKTTSDEERQRDLHEKLASFFLEQESILFENPSQEFTAKSMRREFEQGMDDKFKKDTDTAFIVVP